MWGPNAAIAPFDDLVTALENGEFKAVWMMGAFTPCSYERRARFVELIDELDLFVLQSPHAAELAEKAHICLPASTHAEKDGTFVNTFGIAQSFHEAFRPRGGSLPDWQIFLKMAAALGEPFSYTFLTQIQDEMFQASQPADADAAEAETAPPPAE